MKPHIRVCIQKVHEKYRFVLTCHLDVVVYWCYHIDNCPVADTTEEMLLHSDIIDYHITHTSLPAHNFAAIVH